MSDAPLPPLVDTHCHLVLLDGDGLLSAALEGAERTGVETIVSVGVNLDDSRLNRELAERYEQVYFSVGWHPHEPAPPETAQVRELESLLQHPKAVAVGEIGLDCFWRPGYHEVPLDVQRRSLRTMLELAQAHHKPVLVHDRDAHHEVLAALEHTPEVTGIMHCYSGDVAHARRCAERGFIISFSGIVTFRGADSVRAAAQAVDTGGYVVETDSPFLSPVPHRGRTNLPERVAVTAAEVARLRSSDEATARAESTATARRVLGIPAA